MNSQRPRCPIRSGDTAGIANGAVPRIPVALLVLAAALILPELLLSGADLGLWGSVVWRPLAYSYGGFWAGLLHGWRPNYAAQPWTMFLSYGFLHAGPGHLIGNLGALAWLARLTLARASLAQVLAVYAAAAIGGAAVFGLLTRQPAPMVGASGAIFGLAGAWVVWEARDSLFSGLPRRPVLVRAALTAFFFAALNLAVWWLQDGRLAWQTHLGGFLTGAALAALWPGRPAAGKRATG
jgi:membrane associated rhomboid family serine protease